MIEISSPQPSTLYEHNTSSRFSTDFLPKTARQSSKQVSKGSKSSFTGSSVMSFSQQQYNSKQTEGERQKSHRGKNCLFGVHNHETYIVHGKKYDGCSFTNNGELRCQSKGRKK